MKLSGRLFFVFALLVAASVLGTPQRVEAQVTRAQAQALAGASPEEIITQLRESGLSREQVKTRLRRAGYDPELADPYFDAMEGEGGMPAGGAQGERLANALRDVGVTLRGTPSSIMGDTLMIDSDSVLWLDSLQLQQDSLDQLPQLFGRALFRQRTNRFSALQNSAVGSDYRLGPGDELLLILTGDVEAAYTLDVNREGIVVIPDVGQVSVVGRTLEQLDDVLRQRLGQAYSGIRESPATTRFSVSLGALRTISIFVGGEVERPGRYPVSSVATLLEALYEAGGPNEIGSLRRIRIDRAGNGLGEFDLYPYLVRGSATSDIRLEQGDLVFVPPAESLVTVEGAVRREAIFEMLDGEGVSDLVRFAGGLHPYADTRRAEVKRILPPAERSAGRDRVVLDLPISSALTGMTSFDLAAGDHVQVFETLETIRNSVTIRGAVWSPGTYQLAEGMTLEDLIERAGGTPPDVVDGVVHVARLDQQSGRRALIRSSIGGGSDVSLAEFDEVTLFGRDSLLLPDSVAAFGFVQKPGWYSLSEGMTAEDLVLLAGGFRRGAIPWQVEIVAPVRSSSAQGILNRSIDVSLSPLIPYPDSSMVWPEVGDAGLDPASSVALGADYEVYVRSLPQYDEPRRVDVQGEVQRPGTYVLRTPDETLSSLVARAGGLSDEGYVRGARLERDGLPVGVDFETALAQPGGDEDPTVFDGDRIVVPVYDPTVLVRGAVPFETRIQYRPGMSLDDVVAQAGGYASDADKGRVSVTYPNGRRAVVRKRLLFFSSKPEVRPGSTIVVPVELERQGTDWGQALNQTLAVISAFATVYLAVR